MIPQVITLSHPSFNENSKTNSNPKKRKSNHTGKENNDVEYTSNKIISLLKKLKLLVCARMLKSLAECCTRFLYAVFCNISVLEHNAY